MSWSTDLFCEISFNRDTFNSKYEVERAIEEVDNSIKDSKQNLSELALITDPSVLFNRDESPYYTIKKMVKELLEDLQEDIVRRYKLSILLDNWERCHEKETGLAIYPPDNINWDTAYLCGDFVRSTKYPTNEDLIG